MLVMRVRGVLVFGLGDLKFMFWLDGYRNVEEG